MEFNLELPTDGLEVKKKTKPTNLTVHIACCEIVAIWCFKSISRILFLLSGLNGLIDLIPHGQKMKRQERNIKGTRSLQVNFKVNYHSVKIYVYYRSLTLQEDKLIAKNG